MGATLAQHCSLPGDTEDLAERVVDCIAQLTTHHRFLETLGRFVRDKIVGSADMYPPEYYRNMRIMARHIGSLETILCEDIKCLISSKMPASWSTGYALRHLERFCRKPGLVEYYASIMES